MKTKYYVDSFGCYLGGFAGAQPPAGAIEVNSPPEDARQKWDGLKWLPFYNSLESEIKSRLAQIDIDSVRPLRAIIANTANQHDIDKLSALDEEAVLLREELSTYTN